MTGLMICYQSLFFERKILTLKLKANLYLVDGFFDFNLLDLRFFQSGTQDGSFVENIGEISTGHADANGSYL